MIKFPIFEPLLVWILSTKFLHLGDKHTSESKAHVCEKFDSFAFFANLDGHAPCSVVCIALGEPAMQSRPKSRWPRTFGLYTRAALAGLLFAVLTLPFTNFRLGARVPSCMQNLAKQFSRVR